MIFLIFYFFHVPLSFAQTQRPISPPASSAAEVPPDVSAPSAGVSTNGPKLIENFGDWELFCDSVAAKKTPQAETCRLTLRLLAKRPNAEHQTKTENNVVFLVTVLRDHPSIATKSTAEKANAVQSGDEKREIVTIFSVPLGGYLVPGVELQIDKGKPFRVLFETCNVVGCHGGFALTGRVLNEMQRGQSVRARIFINKAVPIDLRFSLEGFSKALEVLKIRDTKP